MTITLESFRSPTERDVGADALAALTRIAQESFSGDMPATDVRRHVLDVDGHGDFTLLLAWDGDDSGSPVGFGSAYAVEIDGTRSVCAHGLVVSRERPYAGKNLGRVLAFGPVLARLQAEPGAVPVWGRTQSAGIVRFFRSIGGYPRPDEPTPERLLAFVRDVADYLADGHAEVAGHVMRRAYDRRLFSDEDYREWRPGLERSLDGESFDPWNGDAVIFVAEPTAATVRRRLETAVENAEVEIELPPSRPPLDPGT